MSLFLLISLAASSFIATAMPSDDASSRSRTWTADNGNGTFSNPLFFDEFSDPDLIRVGDDYYLTGTTMHAMPGLPMLHSKDLVNWSLLGYAFKRLDYGPEYRLEDGKSIYGQGIWAPCLRYNKGTFYIFSNVNGRRTQVFTAKNPAGPWEHHEMKGGFHDLSVLFDDDGKAYIVWGYRDLRIAQLNEALDDIVPGTEHAPFSKDSRIGEGAHFYKINGKYLITSAWYAGGFRMPCARADSPFGPYEVNDSISTDESFGLTARYRLKNDRTGTFETWPLNPSGGSNSSAMHQGGIVQTQKGEWWGWSMMDANSVGRLTGLSPVTWKDGWPYFGLPGNLGRTPRTWAKPDTGFHSKPTVPYTRNDAFDGPQLANAWQWNHAPADDKWSLTERKGFLRLHALPAADFYHARNTLTQRSIGPESMPTVELDANGLKEGDVAGLALLNYPYAWIGVRRTASGLEVAQVDQSTGRTATAPFSGSHVWLRAHCDFLSEKATFSYSVDGKAFRPLGDEFTMIFQLRTFQGIRYGLFAFGAGGGYADFDNFKVDEPRPSALTRPIPVGKTIRIENLDGGSVLVAKGDTLTSVPSSDPLAQSAAAKFQVVGHKLGRVSLKSPDGRFVTVTGLGADGRVSLAKSQPGDAQMFQWTEMPRGDLLFLSLASHRHLRTTADGSVRADEPGAQFDRKNGASFTWRY